MARPVVEEANKIAPAFSRIFKEMIIITPSHKPLPRAAKGTVMRKAALAEFDEEIQALYVLELLKVMVSDVNSIVARYGVVEASTKAAENIAPPASWTADEVESWLLKQANDISSSAPLNGSKDLFQQGFDRSDFLCIWLST